MKLRTIPSRPGGECGIMLVDCLMYIALLAVILTLTFAAFYRANENAKNLAQNSADIVRALNVGERWREDVRAASGPLRVEENKQYSSSLSFNSGTIKNSVVAFLDADAAFNYSAGLRFDYLETESTASMPTGVDPSPTE